MDEGIRFPIDDQSMKSVVEYFPEVYGFTIQHTHLPCLQVGNQKKVNYLPLEWRWQSAVLGIGFLIILLLARILKEKETKTISPLFVVILGGVIAFLVDGEAHGIPIVGNLKKGINPISISNLQFKSPYVTVAVKAGLITGFIALAEGVAVGRSLALLKNEQIDGNKEMIAFGMMNIAGSFTSCYLTTGPFSKSAVNYHAGCKTPMSNAVHAICMMLVLLFLAPLFKYTPLVALAAIIVVAMFCRQSDIMLMVKTHVQRSLA